MSGWNPTPLRLRIRRVFCRLRGHPVPELRACGPFRAPAVEVGWFVQVRGYCYRCGVGRCATYRVDDQWNENLEMEPPA